MADDRIFWFPSQTGSVFTHAGNARLKIWYVDSGLGSPSNTDTECKFRLNKLHMPFEVDPIAQTFRHSSLKVEILNEIYDATNNVFEQYSILNSTYKTKTFVDLYLDGSIVWHGILDFNQIKKDLYCLDGASIKYRQLKFTVMDMIYYFWLNETDLSDVSYADEQTLETIMQNILAEVNIASGDVILDANLGWDEDSGSSYDMSDFKITGLTSTDLVRDFLKEMLIHFAAFMYNWNGDFFFIKRAGGTTQSVDNDDITSLNRIERPKPLDYLKVETTMDYENVSPSATTYQPGWTAYNHLHEYGNSDALAARQLALELSDILNLIYVEMATLADVQAPLTTPSAATSGSIEDNSLGIPPTFTTQLVESGMVTVWSVSPGNVRCSIVTGISSAVTFTFIVRSDTPDTGENYYVERNPGNVGDVERVYKVMKLTENAADAYNQYYLTDPEILKIKLADISTYDDFFKRYVVNSVNYRAKDIKIHFINDELQLDLVKVT